jgi:hypothetical protein
MEKTFSTEVFLLSRKVVDGPLSAVLVANNRNSTADENREEGGGVPGPERERDAEGSAPSVSVRVAGSRKARAKQLRRGTCSAGKKKKKKGGREGARQAARQAQAQGGHGLLCVGWVTPQSAIRSGVNPTGHGQLEGGRQVGSCPTAGQLTSDQGFGLTVTECTVHVTACGNALIDW